MCVCVWKESSTEFAAEAWMDGWLGWFVPFWWFPTELERRHDSGGWW